MSSGIRHELTGYDSTIAEELSGQAGVEAAVDALKDRIKAEIDAVYPDLGMAIFLLDRE